MFEETIKKMMKPIIQEVYQEGYRDGERRILKAYEYGWSVGHADTMAMLGAIDTKLPEEEAIRILKEEAI